MGGIPPPYSPRGNPPPSLRINSQGDTWTKRRKTFVKKAGKRQAIRLEVSAAISAEADANAERAKAAFKKKCAEGDIGALMLKEKSKSGIMSKKYWELFAAARIQEAEKSGTMSKTTVNGYSVYDDLFADSVVESMKDGAAVIIKSGRISKY